MLKPVGKKSKAVEETPNEQYLLLDLTRTACEHVALAVEEETEGWLTACSLQDAEVQRMLSWAKPRWRFRPTLLKVNEKGAVAFTGFAMKVRILSGLGPWRAARIAKIVGLQRPLGVGGFLFASQQGPWS